MGRSSASAIRSSEGKAGHPVPVSAQRPAALTPANTVAPDAAACDSGIFVAVSTDEFPASEVVDWKVAMHSVCEDRELLKAVVETFLIEAPRLMEMLRGAVQRSEPAGVVQSAHTLKTSLNYFGVRKGFELALHLEKMGRQSELTGIAEPLAAFEEQMAQVTSVLNEYMQPGRA